MGPRRSERDGFDEIIGLAHPDNAGSINVLVKLGFEFQRDQSTPKGQPAKRYRLKRPAPS